MLRKVPKQGRSEEMVACILDGAARVLRRTPLAGTTTNHIAEVAGVSVGSVYQYFDSKETIATTLFRRHLADSAQLLRRVRTESRGLSAEKRLRMPFLELLRDHRGDLELHQNLMGVMETSRPTTETQILIKDIVGELAAVLGEEFPAVALSEIKLCAALRQRYSVILVHSAMIDPALDRDSVVLDHFDSLSKANIRALSARGRSGRRARAS
jgi:AcrR family transcriptional regulator